MPKIFGVNTKHIAKFSIESIAFAMKKIIYILLLLPLFGATQSGPAGVGNSSSNGLWLRADLINQANATAVANWLDTSGNDNDAFRTIASEQPIFYNTSNLNNQPIVRFDGNNDQMVISDSPILDGSSGITYYAVLRPNNLNGNPRGILGKRITYTVNSDYSYAWFFWSGNRINLDVHTNNDRFNTGSTTFSNATNYILSYDFDGSLASSQRSRIRSGSNVVQTGSESSTAIPNSSQDLILGALNLNYGDYLGADYAELIHYNYALNAAEHIIVQNYLSAKYNIPLSSNDLYTHDDPANGNFDYDVAGIGRVDASNMHTDSKGSGIIRINNASNLNDDEFLFWGHNNGIQQATNTSDVPAGVQARLQREWRFSEVNSSGTAVDVGTVNITFDLTNMGMINATDLRLIVDSDNDGNFSDETPLSGATHIGGNLYRFTAVNALNNNSRFTLSTTNQSQTPLPIQLIEFKATKRFDLVELNWKTASELNNDYFTIERSYDGKTWSLVANVKGAGNSTAVRSYSIIDDAPLQSVTYYRLKQTDYDGTTSYSPVISVLAGSSEDQQLIAYPNPTSDQIIIEGNLGALNQIIILNAKGQDVTSKIAIKKITGNRVIVDLSKVSASTYIVKTQNSQIKVLKK